MKKIVFTMGTPAAGKSTVSRAKFPSYNVIDSDEVKKTLDGYDPKNPHLVHLESKKIVAEMFSEALKTDENYVVDGTGANAEKLIRRMTEAKAHGFEVELLYVVVSLKTSLKRNSLRERIVPEEVVIEKYNDIRYSFEAVAPHADIVNVINNE